MTTESMAATGSRRPSGRDALAVLRWHYEERLGALRGRPGLVGVVGSAAPAELILAAGKLPVLVAPEPPHPTPHADPWMEPEIEWELRSVVERALRGDCELVELLIVTRSYHEVYYYLKEIVRQGQGAVVPPLAMYDLMQSQRAAVRPYGLGQTEALRDRLARLAGHPLSDDDLRAAIALTNRRRRAIRELLERRRQGQVAGATAVRAIGAAYFMEPAVYAETLAGWLGDLEPAPDLNGRPRLLVVPSEPLHHPALHDALEAAGGLVVAEDDWWGSRAAGADVPEDAAPLTAIFETYFTEAATLAVSPRAPREAWPRQQIEQGNLDAVVFYVPPSDHLFGWYYPGLKEYLDERGVPSLLLRQDVLDDDGRAAISAQAGDFVRGLRRAAPAAGREAT
jgi:benzoyl-CoA reductase/2-hydroxyglutaryl-CoA dehydratase subunit BcrC/BadD/HgdB